MRLWHLGFAIYNHIQCFCLNGLILHKCAIIFLELKQVCSRLCVYERERMGRECSPVSAHQFFTSLVCICSCSPGCGLMNLTAVRYHGSRVWCVCVHSSVQGPQWRCVLLPLFRRECVSCCAAAACISGPETVRIYPSFPMTHHTSISKTLSLIKGIHTVRRSCQVSKCYSDPLGSYSCNE